VLPSASLPRNPLADIRGTVPHCDPVRFAALQKAHGILTHQSYVLEVKDDGLCVRLRPNVCLQLGYMFFIYSAAQHKYDFARSMFSEIFSIYLSANKNQKTSEFRQSRLASIQIKLPHEILRSDRIHGANLIDYDPLKHWLRSDQWQWISPYVP
jgi:hypothetical protein